MKNILMNPGTANGATSVGLLFMRILAGSLMLYLHGWPKWLQFAEKSASFSDPLGIGSPLSLGLTIFAEVVCSALIVVGLCTRWAALVLAFTMLVAAFIVHGSDPMSKKELALLYVAPFIALIFSGAGRVSIDAALNGNSA